MNKRIKNLVIGAAVTALAFTAVDSLPYFHTWEAVVVFTTPDGQKVAGPRFLANHVMQYGRMTCFHDLTRDLKACVTDVDFEFAEVPRLK